MTQSIYLQHGTRNEQLLLEDVIVESLKHRGLLVYYIPREVVGKDQILGEDRLSKFKKAFGIEMYLENVDGFDGSGAFMSKFGLQLEQSATFTVARRTWEKAVGRYGVTNIPGRPNEGDLLYFPLSDSLLEIKFVDHQNPFYQLGKLYIYQLQVETFQYASEHIDTGIPSIDAFESLKSYDTNPERNEFGGIFAVEIVDGGSGYTRAPEILVIGGGTGAELIGDVVGGELTSIEIVDGGYGFNSIDDIVIEVEAPTSGGTRAMVVVTEIKTNVDMSHSYGDNNKFKKEAKDILFNEDNPFGELK